MNLVFYLVTPSLWCCYVKNGKTSCSTWEICRYYLCVSGRNHKKAKTLRPNVPFHKSFEFTAGLPCWMLFWHLAHLALYSLDSTSEVWGFSVLNIIAPQNLKGKKKSFHNQPWSNGTLINVRSAVDGLMIRPAHKHRSGGGGIEGEAPAINPSDIFTLAQLFRVGRTVCTCFFFFFFLNSIRAA